MIKNQINAIKNVRQRDLSKTSKPNSNITYYSAPIDSSDKLFSLRMKLSMFTSSP